MCDFKDAKVGDRVWSVRFGWGEVVVLHTGVGYPIQVRFHSCSTHRFTYNGVYIDDNLPTLFWDEVKIVPPPKPKRRVKKVIEGWVYFFKSTNHDCLMVGGCGMEPTLYPTKEVAIAVRNKGLHDGPPVIFVHYEYEVEE